MHNKAGSMVLTCVFFISICMLIMLLQWRSQESLRAIMVLRTEVIQTHYAAEALLQYGIELCKKQYVPLAQILHERGRPLVLTFKRWPIGEGRFARGILEISYNALFSIVATLHEEGTSKISISCCLTKQRETETQKYIYTITAWKRHEIRQ